MSIHAMELEFTIEIVGFGTVHSTSFLGRKIHENISGPYKFKKYSAIPVHPFRPLINWELLVQDLSSAFLPRK